MRRLSDIYESARLNIPLSRFPGRRYVPAWEELDEAVRLELEQLKDNVLSVLHTDKRLLASHQRVIGEFNRGVREGFLSGAGDGEPERAARPSSWTPFQWGLGVGRRARLAPSRDPRQVKQFITATHLLAYEFGQLHMAFHSPVEFLLRSIAPERADELGELVFALPVLVHYHRALVDRILDGSHFSFADYYAEMGPAPSHLDYLAQGLVALFDPEPASWKRGAASLGLATKPFLDGTSLRSEHFQAPEQAALTVLRRPIAAHEVVRRQVARIELARSWLGTSSHWIDLEEDADAPASLWDIYQLTPAASIRAGDRRMGDLVASTVCQAVSDHLETKMRADQSRLEFLRRHFLGFLRGFDARCESVVDPKALDSVAFGRALSDGFRRFEGGGPLIGAVSEALADLARMLNELYHAQANPGAHVHETLRQTRETPVAQCLIDLFESHPALLRELFLQTSRFELYAHTQIQTYFAYDLLRGALVHIARATDPDVEKDHERHALLEAARGYLSRLLRPLREEAERLDVTAEDLCRERRANLEQAEVLEAGLLFDAHFDTLVRLMGRLRSQLYTAKVLAKPSSAFSREPASWTRAERSASA